MIEDLSGVISRAATYFDAVSSSRFARNHTVSGDGGFFEVMP